MSIGARASSATTRRTSSRQSAPMRSRTSRTATVTGCGGCTTCRRPSSTMRKTVRSASCRSTTRVNAASSVGTSTSARTSDAIGTW
jgi:hypothetical protein